MAYNNPSIVDFKAWFTRDFPYGTDPNTGILDADIGKAFQYTNMLINQGLWDSQENYTLGYLLLSAHNLVIDIRNSSQGINGQFGWLEQSKSVGSVSASYNIPQRVLDNPNFAQYFTTLYGAQYVNLLWPLLSGMVYTVPGRTRA